IRARSPVQTLSDDQGDWHGHRRLRELPVRAGIGRAGRGGQHARRRYGGTPAPAGVRPVGRLASQVAKATRMSAKSRPLLIVEDDPALQKQICWAFDQYETLAAVDRDSAVAQLRRHAPPVVTMDLGLPPDPDSVTEGFKLLEQILELAPDTKVIVLTGQNDRANAVRAIGCGAYDFFAKPFEPELLGLTIDRAFRLYDLQQENRRLQESRQPDAFGALLTRDPELLRICRVIEKVASTAATVL